MTLLGLRNVLDVNILIAVSLKAKLSIYLFDFYSKKSCSYRFYSSRPNVVNLSYTLYDDQPVGNEYPILIAHGLFGSKSNWHSLCKVIHKTSQRKVIAVDARNHGDSPHDDTLDYSIMSHDIKALCKKLELNKIIFIGHSMGGKTGMVMALTKPDLVEKLVVVDISPCWSGSAEILSEYITVLKRITFPANITKSQARSYADKELKQSISDIQIRQFLLTNLIEKGDFFSWRINLNSIEKNFQNILEFPNFSTSYLGPTLFIGGELSKHISDDDKPEIQRLFPRSEIKYVPEAGHFVHAEKPNEFLEILIPFVKS